MVKQLHKKVKEKLSSRRGISITVALLLFLVCAVVGSIVLASATTASGRLAGLAESDRRYYAVTSAAQLFRDALDGQELTVQRTKFRVDEYTWNEGSSVPATPTTEGTDQYKDAPELGGTSIDSISEFSFIDEATLDYVLGIGWEDLTGDYESAYTHKPGEGSNSTSTIRVTGDGLQTVDVEAKMTDGVLTFTFTNKPDKTTDPTFSLHFTLTPTYESKDRERTVDGTTEAKGTKNSETGEYTWTYTRKSTTTTENTVIVTWQASAIEQGAAK